MNRRTATPIVIATLSVALLATGYLFLAPSQLGGSTRYAIVEGSSMEPKLSGGDLAVVRSRGEVSVGDVVLYRDSDLGVEILHRVTALERHRLVLQGDSNDFLDDARPTAADVEGSLWFSVPHAGSALAWTREPLHAAFFRLRPHAPRPDPWPAGERRDSKRDESSMTRRRVAAAVCPLAAASVLVGAALAATSIVPSSRAGRNLQATPANSLKPALCTALNLNGILTGSGTFSDSNQPHLVAGSAGVDLIRGMGGNDCILGGSGNDVLRGDGGVDVCIGGPGTDSFNVSCEALIQ